MTDRIWSVQDAMNRFSEVVEAAQQEPQTVTKHGSLRCDRCCRAIERLRKLQQLDAPSFAEAASIPRGDLAFERIKAKPRDVEFGVPDRHARVSQLAKRRRSGNVEAWFAEQRTAEPFASASPSARSSAELCCKGAPIPGTPRRWQHGSTGRSPSTVIASCPSISRLQAAGRSSCHRRPRGRRPQIAATALEQASRSARAT